VVIGVLVSAQETKARLAVVIASVTYLAERLDALVGILTTRFGLQSVAGWPLDAIHDDHLHRPPARLKL
jgi:hypothetical protein